MWYVYIDILIQTNLFAYLFIDIFFSIHLLFYIIYIYILIFLYIGECRHIALGSRTKSEFLSSVTEDVQWLRKQNIMDYSLLVGIGIATSTSSSDSSDSGELRRLHSLWRAESSTGGSEQNRQNGEGGESGIDIINHALHEEGIFVFGIVDILQQYNLIKKMEHAYKTGLYSFEGKDPSKLSVVDPQSYGKRLLVFLDQHTL